MGRPRTLKPDDATLRQLQGLGAIQCTTREGAAAMGVTEPTFLKFLKDYPEAREAFETGKGQGLVSLRRKQFQLADKNAAMAIFLGKNYLGQSDRQEHQLTGANGGPIQTIDLSGATDDDLIRLEALLGPVIAQGPGGGAAGPGEGGDGAA